jgi:DNA polymerase alpha subunit B
MLFVFVECVAFGSFYPIFPVPQDLAHDTNLDISHSDALNLDCDGESDFAPDILIVPSRLKQFSKVCTDILMAVLQWIK